MNKKNERYNLIIKPRHKWYSINLIEIFQYRDLIWLFVKRDFVTFYKQTILGPIWYIIQPVITSIVFTFIFGKLAGISTDGTPPFLFYLCGMLAWSYFSTCFVATSTTFKDNSDLFGKVYFPRLTVPISLIIISFLQFFIQSLIFIFFYIVYIYLGYQSHINIYICLLPFLIFQIALLSLGFGTLISSLTTKYRDLSFALGFLVQLWMFATPIVYPFSIIPEKYKLIMALNPMTSVVEMFKLAFFGSSAIEFQYIFISLVVTLIVFVFGFMMFHRIEKNFMDTI